MMMRTAGRKSCPVIGCMRERRGIFCPECWHALPHWMQIRVREQMTPKALAAFHKAELDKWWPLIKGANLKAE